MYWTPALSSNRDNFDGGPKGFRVVGIKDRSVESAMVWADAPPTVSAG
jgi:hypothetical protein